MERLAQEKIEHEKSLAEKHAALAVKEKALKQREEDLEARLDGLRTQEHAVSGRLKDLDHATKLLEERIAAYIALRADQRRENEMSKDDVPGLVELRLIKSSGPKFALPWDFLFYSASACLENATMWKKSPSAWLPICLLVKHQKYYSLVSKRSSSSLIVVL